MDADESRQSRKKSGRYRREKVQSVFLIDSPRNLTRFACSALVQKAIVLPHCRVCLGILRRDVTGVGVANDKPRDGTDEAQEREYATESSKNYECQRRIGEKESRN
jgi:hypothetical protein